MKILCVAFALISIALSAPTPGQYLLYTPSATQFYQQYQLQPQFIQTTTDFRIKDGKQVIYYYPTAPITPFTTTTYLNPHQVIALKDEGGQQGGFDWVGFFQNWFQGGGQGESGAAPSGESGAAAESSASSESKKFDLEKEMAKMSPEKRKEFEQKFLIITGSPFYNGVFNEAQRPLFTLQPLALAPKETSLVAETILKPKLTESFVVVDQPLISLKTGRSLEGQEAPVVAPIEAAAPVPLVPAPVVEPVEGVVVPATKILPGEPALMPEMEMMEIKEEMKEEVKKEEMMMEVMMEKEMEKEMMTEKKLEEKKPEGETFAFAQRKYLFD